MSAIVSLPGQLTDQEQTREKCEWLHAHGYEWEAFQVVNALDPNAIPFEGTGIKDRNLVPAKEAGMLAGVWGVSYGDSYQPSVDVFYRDGKALGAQATKLKADFVTANLEHCFVNTRGGGFGDAFIDGVHDGGWPGAVNLSTLGVPDNPKTAANPHGNDYGMDVQPFLDSGGGLFAQCYYNAYPGYVPDLAVDYWRNLGVPLDRLNITIELAEENGRRMAGVEWVPLLRKALVKRNLSIFMTEHVQPYDLEGLHEFSLPVDPPPPPPALVNPAVKIANILRECDEWLAQFPGDLKPLSRLRMIRRIAATTDPVWVAGRSAVKAGLDKGKLP